MSDIESILCVLAAFTVAYAFVWIRPGGILFVSHFGESHRIRWLAGHSLLLNYRGGLLLGNLTPIGSSFVTAPWPLTISPAGVLQRSPTAPTPDGKPDDSDQFIAFADLVSAAADERTLKVNGERFLTFGSKTAAHRWAQWLTELKGISEADRAIQIEKWLAESCDSAVAERTFDECRNHTRSLRLIASALFAYCFLGLGFVAFAGWSPSMRQVIPGYAYLAILTFWFHRQAGRKLATSHGGHSWTMLVFPVDAFRAADHLFRERLEIYHPLALCRRLAHPAVADDFARRVVRDIFYPLPDPNPPADAQAQATTDWFAERMQRAILKMFGDAGLDTKQYFIPPLPNDAGSIGYCPRCDGQFLRDSGECTACGIAVLPLVWRAKGGA